ncbi:MAG TPA: DinB family protein, partial [Chitinophagaceae bacterium]|nr:DinB family protein [Chitinophagaceae bacterium]
KGIFTSFTGRMTATGFDLTSLADALEFKAYHEGLHLGMMMSIRKLI